MGGSSGPSVPKPSAEERELLRSQTDLLRQAQGLTEENIRRQDLLSPLLFEQFGIRPIFAEEPDMTSIATTQPVNMEAGVFARGPETVGDAMMSEAGGTVFDPTSGEERQALAALAAEEGLRRRGGFTNQFLRDDGGAALVAVQGPGGDIQFVERSQLDPTRAFVETPAAMAASEPEGPSIGDLIGFEEIPDTPEELLRRDLERGLLERTQAALSGDLPIDPALERSIADRETQLRAQLMRQLGPGFETSSPGMEALSRFRRDVEQLRGSARRSDLATAAGLSEGFTTGRERSRALDVAGIQDILGRQMGGASNLGAIASGFASPIGQLANQRNMEFRSNIAAFQQPTIGQTIGQLAGTVGGAFLGGPGALGLFPSLVRGSG